MQRVILYGGLLVRLLFAAQMALVIFGVSCTTKSTSSSVQGDPRPATTTSQGPSSAQNVNSPPPQAAPSPSVNQQSSPVRDLDFKNFTFPWYPKSLKPPYDSRQVTLRDGKFEVERDEKRDVEWFSLELDNVSYADLTGDGKEEAIVVLAGIVTHNSFVNAIFVYAVEKGSRHLLWQHETGDRANGGLRRIGVENGAFVIEEYVRSEGDGGLCCPTKFTRTYYRWDKGHLEKTKLETLHNEYETGRFLGYPTNPS